MFLREDILSPLAAHLRHVCMCGATTLVLIPTAALAHDEGPIPLAPRALQAALIALMVASAFGYWRGVVRLWHRAGFARGIAQADIARFALGWATLAAALFSPIDTLADRSFAVHMVQHELLMVVAAPLLVTSRAFEAWAWALPHDAAHVLGRIGAGWRRLAAPGSAWWTHAAAIWIWHVPAFFAAALASVWLHDLQHVSFSLSALLFWWAVFERRAGARDMTSLALLLTTMLHTGALGFFLTFAPTPWYASSETASFGLTALEDQQLGGLVMWIVGGLAYVVAALVVVWAWLSAPAIDDRRREAVRRAAAQVPQNVR
jgi:putative membrane protein